VGVITVPAANTQSRSSFSSSNRHRGSFRAPFPIQQLYDVTPVTLPEEKKGALRIRDGPRVRAGRIQEELKRPRRNDSAVQVTRKIEHLSLSLSLSLSRFSFADLSPTFRSPAPRSAPRPCRRLISSIAYLSRIRRVNGTRTERSEVIFAQRLLRSDIRRAHSTICGSDRLQCRRSVYRNYVTA